MARLSEGYDTGRYQDPTYDHYPAQNFSVQQTEKFAQLNQQSFASNNAVPHQYLSTGPTVLSFQPMSGIYGTKVFMKISSQYDLLSMSSAMQYSLLGFGSKKVPVQDLTQEAQDTTGFIYSCSVDAPQLMVTGCNGNNVPLSFITEGPTGEEISRTGAGSFQYLEGSGDDITRTSKLSKHDTAAPGPQVDQASASPKTVDSQLPPDTATNSYDYPSQQSQYANAFPQSNGDMITTYRSSSFTEPHYRRSAPSWSGFGGPMGSTRSSLDHSAMGSGRPSLTPLPMPSSAGNGTPQLIRTSTIANGASSNGSYHPISLYSSKAVLKINGKLDTMGENWSQEEWDNRRRIVMFRKSQAGSTLTANFRAVPVNERPTNSICVSCIWWAEKGDCYVTSVDTIHLLEQLVASPNRFSVEEKNRIRRNLEGFHPLTVSKAKADSEEFFKIIMGFPNPKPRNIEKDVKVFPWKILEPALKKIIGKYSASPSSTLPPSNMMTSVSTTPYAPLPTPPGHGIASQQSLPPQHGDPHSQYSVHSSHHDPIPSPRSLSGSQSTWTPYSTASAYAATTRALSPANRHASPQQGHQHAPPMRINTNPLPAVTTYDSRSVSTAGYSSSGLHTPISQHPSSTATPPRWDSTSASYPDSYPSLNPHHQPGPPVYSTATYGDGATRA
ncbi:MedA [Metarhizium rileyi]|uniref:MedA n=1 Tax=Metarhizium rileyi (strain RCEF 4871) TaxID=1649241 RepID=A0A162LVW9_METRR|nr:MedA [Metarhizium rileyi RCEF 4871]